MLVIVFTVLVLYSSPLIYSEQLAKQLYQATKDGDIDQVTTPLKQGVNPNNTLYWSDVWGYPKYPPLHEACYNGNLKLAKLLVKSGGATTDKGDRKNNMTPLHWACRSGDKDTVMYLIEEIHCDVGECILITSVKCCYMYYLYSLAVHYSACNSL